MTERPFPLDFSALETDPKPRTWLVLPEGFVSASEPDAVSPVFAGAPETVLDAFINTGLGAPRTELVRQEGLQAELCQRSLVFRFPDYITVEAMPVGDHTALAIYSRAVLGYSDIGVNRKRITRWLEALSTQALGSS